MDLTARLREMNKAYDKMFPLDTLLTTSNPDKKVQLRVHELFTQLRIAASLETIAEYLTTKGKK